jgi:hypothetical protein
VFANAFDGKEDISGFPDGLTMYTSSFSSASYPESGGKLWHNQVSTDERAVRKVQQAEDDQTTRDDDGPKCSIQAATQLLRSRRLHFHRTPTFSRKDGFVMGTNSLVGPYSFRMGIRGDMAFTLFFLCQFTGGVTEPVTVFRLFANTHGNNGLAFVITEGSTRQQRDAGGGNRTTGGGERRALRMKVVVGDAHEIQLRPERSKSDALVVDSDRKYMFSVTKNYNRVRVDVHDVASDEEPRTLLADVNIGTHSPILLSNKDMVVNEHSNWNANIQAFGVFDRALTPREVTSLYEHYHEMYRQLDTAYVQLAEKVEEMAKLRACPFDAPTCHACRGVEDWTNIENVYASTEECRKAIAAFCSKNTTHERCKCWNANHPAYDTQCKAHRCAMSGETAPECRPPPQQAPQECPKDPKMSPDEVRQMLAVVVQQEQKRAESDTERDRLEQARLRAQEDQARRAAASPMDDEEYVVPKDENKQSFWAWLFGW